MKFKDILNEELKDPEFKKEWDGLEEDYKLMSAMADIRKELNVSQKELSSRTGISQGDISKLENGVGNPSLNTLKKIAEGLGCKLQIQFIPYKRV